MNAIERTNQFASEIGNFTPMPNHIKRKHVHVEPVSYPPDVVYRPGQQVTFEPPAHPLNLRTSYLRGTLHIGEINSNKTMSEVITKYRTVYKEAIVSRPGAAFSGYPLPVESIDKAKLLAGTTRLGAFDSLKTYTSNTKFGTYTDAAITPYTAERKYITEATANIGKNTEIVDGNKSLTAVTTPVTMPVATTTGLTRHTEVGFVLNRRSMAYGMTVDIDDYDRYRLYDRYSDGNTLTPDEALSTWDAFNFYFDTRITPNSLYGYFCRSAFNLFNRIQIGTSSNINLFEDNQIPGVTAILDMMEFEEDHFSSNRSCFWSSSRIPEVFGWRGFTNQRLVGLAETGFQQAATGTKLTSDWDGSVELIKITRDYIKTGNPKPFYFPAQDIDFAIPLPALSGCLDTDLHLNQNHVNNLMITVQLQGLDHVFDMGMIAGYHEGRALVDMVSLGSLTNFIRNILEIHDWTGWHIKGLRLDLTILDIEPQALMQMYLPLFQVGRARPFLQQQHYEVATILGTDLTKMATAMRSAEYKLQFGQGIIAGIAFYATIDGVQNAYVPIFDTLALQIGTTPTVINFPDDVHRPYTVSDLYRQMLHIQGKADTHISNIPYDFVYGYGVPSHRRRLYEHEYFKHPQSDQTAETSINGISGGKSIYTRGPYTTNTTTTTAAMEHIYKTYIDSTVYSPSDDAAKYPNPIGVEPIEDVRSIHSIYATKKMCGYEHSHFALFDLRGDAPTAGSALGTVMSGINTSNMNNLYGNLHLAFRDTSLYERYKDRRFTIHMLVQMERVMITQVAMDQTGNWRSSYHCQKDMQLESSMNNSY